MVRTWSTEQGRDETCEKCGSVYEVHITRFPGRDADKFNCDVCGHLMREWNDTESPSFRLKTRGTPPGASPPKARSARPRP